GGISWFPVIGFVRFCGHLKEGIESFPMMLRPHESDAWMPSFASQSFEKKYGIVLAEINEIYCALLR
ncbi:18476_t:CDS:1, partial [Acaulospora morrowiae]